jgi:3-dehydroquinate dehydratase-2
MKYLNDRGENLKLLLMNGPNLNLLGKREPDKYGKLSYEKMIQQLVSQASRRGADLISFQSNSEGELIDFIHKKSGDFRGAILNPGALTHTSIALRDALTGVGIPFIEVHITNIYNREPFRHRSYFKDIALGQIVGLGVRGYSLALEALIQMIEEEEL